VPAPWKNPSNAHGLKTKTDYDPNLLFTNLLNFDEKQPRTQDAVRHSVNSGIHRNTGDSDTNLATVNTFNPVVSSFQRRQLLRLVDDMKNLTV